MPPLPRHDEATRNMMTILLFPVSLKPLEDININSAHTDALPPPNSPPLLTPTTHIGRRRRDGRIR